MQTRRRLDLSSQIGIMLSGYAWCSVALLTSAIDTVTSGTDVRVQLLSYTEVLARATHWIRVRIHTRKIVSQRDDVILIAERRMRRHDLHCRIYTRSRSEHGHLLFQITLLLAGKVRDVTIRRAPGVGLVADHARSVEPVSVRRCGCRLRYTTDC